MTDDELSDAACRGMDPNTFFPGQGGDVAYPKSICATCPVIAPCLEEGLHHATCGIWGGTAELERESTRRRLGIKVESYGLPPGRSWSKAGCGTSAGYM